MTYYVIDYKQKERSLALKLAFGIAYGGNITPGTILHLISSMRRARHGAFMARMHNSRLKHDDYQIEGLPRPVWGTPVPKAYGLRCAECGSSNVYYSGSPADPEEILHDTVRCSECGWLTDWYEDYKAGRR